MKQKRLARSIASSFVLGPCSLAMEATYEFKLQLQLFPSRGPHRPWHIAHRNASPRIHRIVPKYIVCRLGAYARLIIKLPNQILSRRFRMTVFYMILYQWLRTSRSCICVFILFAKLAYLQFLKVCPQQRKLIGSSAQNSFGVRWCRRQVRFNEVPEKVQKVPKTV